MNQSVTAASGVGNDELDVGGDGDANGDNGDELALVADFVDDDNDVVPLLLLLLLVLVLVTAAAPLLLLLTAPA